MIKRILKRMWLDARAGKCSGFPSCCIAFYTVPWRLFYGSTQESLHEKPAWKVRLIRKYHRSANDAGYVPCPLCILSGARVKVQRCTTQCGHIEESRKLILEIDPTAFDR